MRRLPLLLHLAVLSLVAVACRTGARGAAGPDAVAIVEGRVDSTVHTDTITDPFTVALNRARWSTRTRTSEGTDFWSDIAVLDVASAQKAARSMDERTFVFALQTLMASDPDGAAVAFGALYSSAHDPIVRGRARVGLTMALSWGSDWPRLARVTSNVDSTFADAAESERQASVERWAQALADVPAPDVFVPDEPVVLPMRRSAFGTPVITVKVNGRPHEFWLDTGASMTLLSAEVAIRTGVYLAAPDTLALGVVAGHIPARAVIIDSLDIGPVKARGLSAAVVEQRMLRLDRRLVHGQMESIPIDGVIGTDLLRRMDVVLDAGAGTMTIRRPRPDRRAKRNLYWIGYPVVKLVTRDGRPVLFGLDTGAEGTYVTTSLLQKLPRTGVAARRMTLGGLGTGKERTEWVARDIALSDGDYAITLRNAPVTPERRWTFVLFDGVIGSDVALATRMHLDFANGVFDVRPSSRVGETGMSVTVEP
jgi:clan AA aspartic protease (TIGR02281 family)